MNVYERDDQVTILMAEDDEDDRDLARDAFADAGVNGKIQFVLDGQELLDYLRDQGSAAERPGIIVLDLNMPRKDGREALAELKADETLRKIPVIVLTTSTDEQDVSRCYSAGASSYVAKPVSHSGLVEVMRTLKRYWFEFVELPHPI